MTRHRPEAKVLWRAVREWFARFSRLVAETGNSDEDLVFRVQKSQPAPRAAGCREASSTRCHQPPKGRTADILRQT